MRAISRRSTRMRPVFSTWPLARWKRRLNCSFFSVVSWVFSSSALLARMSSALEDALAAVAFLVFFAVAFLAISISSQAGALHELGRDGQLGLSQAHGFLRRLEINAVDLKRDAARLHLRNPEFRGTLARAHADFGGLFGHRHVREDTDPDAAGTLQFA